MKEEVIKKLKMGYSEEYILKCYNITKQTLDKWNNNRKYKINKIRKLIENKKYDEAVKLCDDQTDREIMLLKLDICTITGDILTADEIYKNFHYDKFIAKKMMILLIKNKFNNEAIDIAKKFHNEPEIQIIYLKLCIEICKYDDVIMISKNMKNYEDVQYEVIKFLVSAYLEKNWKKNEEFLDNHKVMKLMSAISKMHFDSERIHQQLSKIYYKEKNLSKLEEVANKFPDNIVMQKRVDSLKFSNHIDQENILSQPKTDPNADFYNYIEDDEYDLIKKIDECDISYHELLEYIKSKDLLTRTIITSAYIDARNLPRKELIKTLKQLKKQSVEDYSLIKLINNLLVKLEQNKQFYFDKSFYLDLLNNYKMHLYEKSTVRIRKSTNFS